MTQPPPTPAEHDERLFLHPETSRGTQPDVDPESEPITTTDEDGQPVPGQG